MIVSRLSAVANITGIIWMSLGVVLNERGKKVVKV